LPDASPAPHPRGEWNGHRLQKVLAGAVLLAIFLLIFIFFNSQFGVGWRKASSQASIIPTPSSETFTSAPPQTLPPSPLPLNAPVASTQPEEEVSTTISADQALAYARNNPPIFEDDFSDPDSGWQREIDSQASRFYANGAYVVRLPAAIGLRNQVNVPLPIDTELADFVLELSLKVDAGLGSAGGLVGFREHETDNLFAGLSASPCQAFIGVFSPGGEDVLGQNTNCGWLADARSHLTLIAAGHLITLLVNDEQRVAAETQITAPGTIHLLITNTGGEDVVLRVEKVRLWDLGPLVSGATP
jgi:hypothetical protein